MLLLYGMIWKRIMLSGQKYVNYVLTGSAPNRVLTIEWDRHRWNYVSSNNVISFQVKLYETTNIIEFHYNQGANAVNSSTCIYRFNRNYYWFCFIKWFRCKAPTGFISVQLIQFQQNQQMVKFIDSLHQSPPSTCIQFLPHHLAVQVRQVW